MFERNARARRAPRAGRGRRGNALTRVAPTAVALATLAALAGCQRDNAPLPTSAPVSQVVPPAPVGIGIEPGPFAGALTVTWTPVDQARQYALYWSTSPGVTPANGVRALGALTSFIHQSRTPGTTYYYVVAAIGPDLEGPPSAEISGQPLRDIAIHVETPAAGDQVGATVPISAVVTSVQPLQSLIASMGNATTPLTFDPSIGRWTGTLSLDSLASPAVKQLVIAATAAQSDKAQANMYLRFDQPPQVTVSSPADSTAAEPTVRITATCTDDGTAGCVSLRAFVAGSENAPLLTGTGSIDGVVSLAVYTGSVTLVVEGVDAAGQTRRVVRTVLR